MLSPDRRQRLRAADDRLLLRLAILARRVSDWLRSRRSPGQLYRDHLPWSTVVVTVLLLAVAAVPVVDTLRDPQDAAGGSTPVSTDPVGPTPGQPVAAYLAAAAEELDARLAANPRSVAYAVVHFNTYLAPDAVKAALPGVRPVRALLRLPRPRIQTEIHDVPVVLLPDSLTLAYREVARGKLLEAIRTERTLAAGGAVDPATRAAAAVAREEAEAYRDNCACVFAMVVQGTLEGLAELPDVPQVRGVDLAPPRTSPVAAPFFGLLPEQTTTVQPPGTTPAPSPS